MTANPLPTPDEISKLKRLAAGIIRAQGNRFVKELLRDKKIRIGTNKRDFNRNLNQAIEKGELRLDEVDHWLKGVEGWGNQYVYLYRIPPTLRKELTEAAVQQRVKDAGLQGVWNAPTVLQFPKKPELTSISFTGDVLRLVWQESSPDWTPSPEKNFKRREGLDTYEYRAFRQIDWRAITRFEAHLDLGLAGVFIGKPLRGEEHSEAKAAAESVAGRLMDFAALKQFDINDVSKNLDQKNVPDNITPIPKVKTQKSRLGSGGAYVEFGANSADKAFWEEPAILNVRKSIGVPQLQVFQGTGGVFIFQEPAGLTRPLRVQLFSEGNRVWLRAEMNASEVWTILAILNAYQP